MHGYWADSSFTGVMAELFETGLVYANFHTSVNPDGEVRGQVTINNLCLFPLAVSRPAGNDYNVSLYPNPVQDELTMEYRLLNASSVEVRVFDITGKQVSTLSPGTLPAGSYRQTLSASQLHKGLYLYTLYINGRAVYKSKVLVNR